MQNGATREEWAWRVTQWRRSGLTAREFAARIGVNRHTLAHWAWRLGASSRGSARGVPATRFVEVVGTFAAPAGITPEDAGPGAASAEIMLAGGLRLRVTLTGDAEVARSVAMLVAALEAR